MSIQNFSRSGLNELKGRGECGAIAVVELDVIGGGGVRIKSDGVANYKGDSFRLRLANGFCCFGPAIRAMKFFMREFMN